MTLKELSHKIDSDLEKDGWYKKSYTMKRISFWLEIVVFIAAGLGIWHIVANSFNLSLQVLVLWYVVIAMAIMWPAYSFDYSPQSPKEVKTKLKEDIMGAIIVKLIDEGRLVDSPTITEGTND